MKILDHHFRHLEASGLTEETIKNNGIYSETDFQKIRSLIACSTQTAKKFGPVIVFPFKDIDGRNGYARIRPDNPRLLGDSKKPSKYESPKGKPNEIYLVDGIDRRLESKTDLFITEGEKKALKATQDGFPTLGLVGVYGWKKKSEAVLLPTLERIDWQDRKVYIAFDSDITENTNVQKAESWLCHHLKNRGAVVKVLRIPSGNNGEKMGMDDFLLSHGQVAFQKLVENAIDPTEIEHEIEKLDAGKADPATEAERIIQQESLDNTSRLRFWSGSFWHWSQGRYIERPTSEIRAMIVQHLNNGFCYVGTTVVSNVLEQLKAKTMLLSTKQPPSWLKPSEWKPEDVVCTNDKIIHLPSYIEGKENCTIAATPRFFSTCAMNYDFQQKSTCTRWLKFLHELWPDDQESIELLQDWFGYCLTPDTRLQKMLFMLGPKRSGKGTIARILKSIVGDGNVCGPTLASLQLQFGLWPLLGKTLAIISDARLSGRSDQAIIAERLLSISGEDAQTVDRKMLEPVTTKLQARFTIISNELPKLQDSSGALTGRMLVLQLNESFYGKEDCNLTEELMQERSGILHWAIEGWERLRERGKFVQPTSGQQTRDQLDELSSPVSAFVRDYCEVDARLQIPIDDLYEAWRHWCDQSGREHYSTKQAFCRDLLAYVRVKQVQPRDGAIRFRAYQGISIKSEIRQEIEDSKNCYSARSGTRSQH